MPAEVFEAIAAGDCERLRERVAREPLVATARDEDGVSALMRARYQGRLDMVEVLVQVLPELDVFEAAALGATEQLREMLAREPSHANDFSADGGKPLHFAAFVDHYETEKLLVDRGADVNAVARGFNRVTPLHSASAANTTDICRLLLEHGADPSARQDGGFTGLHDAAQHGNAELAELLIRKGADPTATTEDGKTARDFAAGNEALLALLPG